MLNILGRLVMGVATGLAVLSTSAPRVVLTQSAIKDDAVTTTTTRSPFPLDARHAEEGPLSDIDIAVTEFLEAFHYFELPADQDGDKLEVFSERIRRIWTDMEDTAIAACESQAFVHKSSEAQSAIADKIQSLVNVVKQAEILLRQSGNAESMVEPLAAAVKDSISGLHEALNAEILCQELHRNVGSDVVGCPRDGAAQRALSNACPDAISFDTLSAVVRGDDETTPSVVVSVDRVLASPDAIAAICRSKSCLDAIRASPCVASTNNATIPLAEAVCGCHAALDVTCQPSFRDAVSVHVSAVVATSQATVHHHRPSNNTNSTDTEDDSVVAAASPEEHETTGLGGGTSVTPTASDDAVAEEPSRRLLPCAPFHCRASLAEAAECATLAPSLIDAYMAEVPCCSSSGDGDTTDADNCGAGSVVGNNISAGSNYHTSAVRRQFTGSRDAANEVLAMAMPDSIMALVEVFIDPPRNTLVDGYLPPLERRVDKLREASINAVGDAVTSPMRDICEWVSRSRNAESGAEDLFWDMLDEPDLITEVCRKVQSNGECLQTAVDVCFGGSTEDFIALADAALTEELMAREYYYADDEYYLRARIQEDYRRGQGWEDSSSRNYWRTDAVGAVGELLSDIIDGAYRARMEYLINGEAMHGDVQGLLNRVIGPMCNPACDRLITSCETVSSLSTLFDLDHFLSQYERDGMCMNVEAPLRTSGAEQRLVRAEATLSGLTAVGDFTEALRSQFEEEMGKAASVPLSHVRVMDVRAGSDVVVVVTEVLIRADNDRVVEAYVTGLQAALDKPTGVFDSSAFGAVSWAAFTASDPNESGVETVFGTPVFGMVLSLAIASLFLVA